jgi:hypothetical protein
MTPPRLILRDAGLSVVIGNNEDVNGKDVVIPSKEPDISSRILI